MSVTPLLVYGDGPRLPSGLGRIARDLLLHLVPEQEALGVAVHQVGVDPPDGWHWQGWPFWGFQPNSHDQGRAAIQLATQELYEQYQTRPVVLMIMDPSRCYDLTRLAASPQEGEDGKLPVRFWGYFPIDSENVHGAISGPAAEAVWSCERVLGYGRYGAHVLHRTLERVAERNFPSAGGRYPATVQVPPVPYLPHGLDAVFRPGVPLDTAGEGFAQWRLRLPSTAWVIGCVATNQPRKDLSLLFAATSLLRREGMALGVWLHTDRLTNAWDVGQLCLDFGFSRDAICVSTADTPLTDEQLAARYGASDVTLAPGLGEGFGYPIVESLACGTPVVHGRFAGGIELIPRSDWLVEPAAWRLESCYAVKRPLFRPEDVAGALAVAGGWKRSEPALTAAYCAGAVSYLQWEALWPRWRAWIQRGLRQPAQPEEGRSQSDGTRRTQQSAGAGRPEPDHTPGLRPVREGTRRGRSDRPALPGHGDLAGHQGRPESLPAGTGRDGGAGDDGGERLGRAGRSTAGGSGHRPAGLRDGAAAGTAE